MLAAQRGRPRQDAGRLVGKPARKEPASQLETRAPACLPQDGLSSAYAARATRAPGKMPIPKRPQAKWALHAAKFNYTPEYTSPSPQATRKSSARRRKKVTPQRLVLNLRLGTAVLGSGEGVSEWFGGGNSVVATKCEATAMLSSGKTGAARDRYLARKRRRRCRRHAGSSRTRTRWNGQRSRIRSAMRRDREWEREKKRKTSNGTYVVGLHVARRRRVHRVALAGGRTTHWDGGLLGTCGQHTEIEADSKNKKENVPIRRNWGEEEGRRPLCRRRKQANCDLVGRGAEKKNYCSVAGRGRVNADGCERDFVWMCEYNQQLRYNNFGYKRNNSTLR